MRALTSSYLSSMARLLRIDSSVMRCPNLFEHFDAPSERHPLGELLVVKGLGLPLGTLQFPLQPLLAQLVEAVPGVCRAGSGEGSIRIRVNWFRTSSDESRSKRRSAVSVPETTSSFIALKIGAVHKPSRSSSSISSRIADSSGLFINQRIRSRSAGLKTDFSAEGS